MAQKGVQFDRETISCSICFDILKEPVFIPCGHSYCMRCISDFWDGEDDKNIYSCLQCNETFTVRPVLVKSTMLGELAEDLRKSRLQAEDVDCDVCTGTKRKASQSCLVCLASYCQEHLQPHYEGVAFKKHKLVDPSKTLQENICSRHDEVMKMFCRTDQQSICYLCPVDQHKGHNTVSAAEEWTEKQGEVKESRAKIQRNIEDKEEYVNFLNQQVEAIKLSADQTVEDTENIFTLLICLVQERSSEVKKEVRSKQQTEVTRLGDHLQDILMEGWTNISLTLEKEDILLSLSEPKTRAEFLKLSKKIILDPNTAHRRLKLSDDDQRATLTKRYIPRPDHPDRFVGCYQVLSTEHLTGRCYWEVEWDGDGVYVAVAYKSIKRTGTQKECLFGRNDNSWIFPCPKHSRQTMRLGVYLNHTAGILSFYCVSDSMTMTLLHRVDTTFTEPLLAGVRILYGSGGSAGFCNL
ncbi:tripartite motif-containing protein 16-like isoform X2 [Gouania willdenowi]|uniref:tripartite motif-containing protein 16-like isoform X2 n=1 Tax=Gouania willdenowi TaxID=441366 RepID=UPI0010553B3B|nr:tripartite motif-containing protein 16-like isoform X2 [Gouania willdenowi]